MNLVIMVGTPGSGKSVYAKKNYPNHVYINQDTLGSRAKVTDAVNEALINSKDIVLDRCNISREQRSPWINKAMMFGYETSCVVLQVDPEICIERIRQREDHQTIPNTMNLNKIRHIVYGFCDSYQEPTSIEGLSTITFVDNV